MKKTNISALLLAALLLMTLLSFEMRSTEWM